MIKLSFYHILFSLIIFVTSPNITAQDKFVGSFKFIENQEKSIGRFKVFFIFEFKEQKLALPVVFKSSKQEQIARNNKQSQFIISAETKEEQITIDGPAQVTKVLQIAEIQKISLKDFALSSSVKDYPPTVSPSEINRNQIEISPILNSISGDKVEVGVRGDSTISGINDNLTNAVIGVGGAALIYSILAK